MAHQTVSYLEFPAECAGPDTAPGPDCPVELTLTALRGRWMPLILLEFLRNDELAFSALATALPRLSEKVLSERLAQLTAAGVIRRHRRSAWPPRVIYKLTDHGRALGPILQAMWQWGTARPGTLALDNGPRSDQS